jgi:hypothetical protein
MTDQQKIDDAKELIKQLKEVKRIFKLWQENTSDLGRCIFKIKNLDIGNRTAEVLIRKDIGIDKNCMDFFVGKFFEHHNLIHKTNLYLFYPNYHKKGKKISEDKLNKAMKYDRRRK